MVANKGTLSIAAGLAALGLGAAPVASAAPGEYVRTESGLTHCWVNPEIVSCETGDIGFLNAPMTEPAGHHYHVASVTSDGDFNWVTGNIGGSDPSAQRVLTYGQTLTLYGWTIEPDTSGTTFTNGTGHGMFVSVQEVTSF